MVANQARFGKRYLVVRRMSHQRIRVSPTGGDFGCISMLRRIVPITYNRGSVGAGIPVMSPR